MSYAFDMEKLHIHWPAVSKRPAMIKIINTTDLDELTAVQEDWEIQHRPVGTDRFEGRLVLGRIGDIRVDLESWNTSMELTGNAAKQGLSFVLPLDYVDCYRSEGIDVEGEKIDVFGRRGQVHALTKRQISLISCTISTAALSVRGDCPLATRLLEQANGHRVVRSTRQATQDLRRWWRRLLDLSAQGSTCVATHDLLFDETLLIMARALDSADEDRGPRPRKRYLLARRARNYLLERQTNPPSIAEVCAHFSTSERTLHNVFSETYGVSPKRFLKAQRLVAVRRALKAATAGEHVSDIATRLGFWDLGYFARDYRAMFGELPSATLRKAGGWSGRSGTGCSSSSVSLI